MDLEEHTAKSLWTATVPFPPGWWEMRHAFEAMEAKLPQVAIKLATIAVAVAEDKAWYFRTEKEDKPYKPSHLLSLLEKELKVTYRVWEVADLIKVGKKYEKIEGTNVQRKPQD